MHKSTVSLPGLLTAEHEIGGFCVPRDRAADFWPHVEKLIDKAYKFADEPMPTDLVDQLSRGERQLWIAWDGRRVIAAALTRIVQLRSCRACHLSSLGGIEGERGRWVHLISLIESFAEQEGCTRVLIEGRKGWKRILKRYRHVRTVLELELTDGRRFQGSTDNSEHQD
jgi:hypothetical protein